MPIRYLFVVATAFDVHAWGMYDITFIQYDYINSLEVYEKQTMSLRAGDAHAYNWSSVSTERQTRKFLETKRKKKWKNDYVSKLAFFVFDFERAHDWNPFFVKNLLIGEKTNNDARYY